MLPQTRRDIQKDEKYNENIESEVSEKNDVSTNITTGLSLQYGMERLYGSLDQEDKFEGWLIPILVILLYSFLFGIPTLVLIFFDKPQNYSQFFTSTFIGTFLGIYLINVLGKQMTQIPKIGERLFRTIVVFACLIPLTMLIANQQKAYADALGIALLLNIIFFNLIFLGVREVVVRYVKSLHINWSDFNIYEFIKQECANLESKMSNPAYWSNLDIVFQDARNFRQMLRIVGRMGNRYFSREASEEPTQEEATFSSDGYLLSGWMRRNILALMSQPTSGAKSDLRNNLAILNRSLIDFTWGDLWQTTKWYVGLSDILGKIFVVAMLIGLYIIITKTITLSDSTGLTAALIVAITIAPVVLLVLSVLKKDTREYVERFIRDILKKIPSTTSKKGKDSESD